jgi:uncharacterized protein YdaU (DUF1376 family)
MKKKIRYVMLESGAFTSDVFFLSMTAEERGVYVSIILYLNQNDGFLPMDKVVLAGFCNCTNFENVFEKIKHKFLIKDGKISHKRVLAELRRARQISQLHSANGVKGNETRWGKSSLGNRPAIAEQSQSNRIKRSEAKGSEDKLREEKRSEAQQGVNGDTAIKVRLTVSQLAAKLASQSNSSNGFTPRLASRPPAPIPKDLPLKMTNLYNELCFIFPKRTTADTSSIRNLTDWVADCISTGKFQHKIIGDILAIARDSKKGKSRKPIAVFYAQLKTDLGYKQDG